MDVFFSDEDREEYLGLVQWMGQKYGVEFWGYCLMPNHVHWIAVPRDARGLALAMGWAHYHYTRRINFREGWRGYLWQGRFYSCPLDEAHTLAALRYVELNPVRAGLVSRPELWPWSSAKAHVKGSADRVLSAAPLIGTGAWWREFLSEGAAQEEMGQIRACTRTGRPWATESFVATLEKTLRRRLRREKPGRKAAKRKDKGGN
jgi:putative transposase